MWNTQPPMYNECKNVELQLQKVFYSGIQNVLGIPMVALCFVFQWCSFLNKMAAILAKTIENQNKIGAILSKAVGNLNTMAANLFRFSVTQLKNGQDITMAIANTDHSKTQPMEI